MSDLSGPASITRTLGLLGADARRLARRRPEVPPGDGVLGWFEGGLEQRLTSDDDEVCGGGHFAGLVVFPLI